MLCFSQMIVRLLEDTDVQKIYHKEVQTFLVHWELPLMCEKLEISIWSSLAESGVEYPDPYALSGTGSKQMLWKGDRYHQAGSWHSSIKVLKKIQKQSTLKGLLVQIWLEIMIDWRHLEEGRACIPVGLEA